MPKHSLSNDLPYPRFIHASGAGIDAVNGTYAFAGMDEFRAPLYEMVGQLEGKATTFRISATGTESKQCWHISADDSDDKHVFYKSNFASDFAFPPVRGWWCVEEDEQGKEDVMPVAPILRRDDDFFLDWRNDPLESLADYKIEISHEIEGAATTTEYNTHKLVLANGSTYFANLLRSVNRDDAHFTETQSNRSQIKLKSSMAKMFPYLLDYLYGQFSNPASLGTIGTTTYEQDVILYQVADYFGASQVLRDLEVVFNDEEAHNLMWWINEVCSLDMIAAVEILVMPCAKKLTELGEEALQQLASVMTEDQLQLLLREKEATVDASKKGSELVAAFCSTHQVDIETFRLLTDAAILPNIDRKAVWSLLERECDLSGSTQGTLSNLQARCIDVLAQDFDAWDNGEDDPLRLQSAAFLYELLKKVKEHKQRLIHPF